MLTILIYLSIMNILSNGLYYPRVVRKVSLLHMSKSTDIRPSLDDVEKISWGKAATRRGTGSRAVPHRLNAMERKEWELAKKRKYLLLRGTGWRKERGASPLANIYRQYCDATSIPAINVERGLNGEVDTVIIDFSPLRVQYVRDLCNDCIQLAQNYSSCTNIVDESDISKLGWPTTSIEEAFESEPIWRIPVFCSMASFSNRVDSKAYAEELSRRIAGATLDSKPSKKRIAEEEFMSEITNTIHSEELD